MAQTYYCPQCKRPIRPDQSMCDLCMQQAQQPQPPVAAPAYGRPVAAGPAGEGFSSPEKMILILLAVFWFIFYFIVTSPTVLAGAGYWTVRILTFLMFASGAFFVMFVVHTVLVRLNAMVGRLERLR